MKNSLKKLVVLLALTFVGQLVFAYTTTVGDITWRWEYDNGGVSLYGDYDNGYLCIVTDDIISGEINIPATIEGRPVVAIGNEAFYDCREITSMTIPQSVVSIGPWAFSGCTKLLANCKRDDGVVIVDGCVVQVYRIYDSGKFLDDVVLPEGTRMIADGVFGAYYSCTLKSLSLPASLTIIGEGAFGNCTIGSISVDANNPNFCVADGVLYDKAKTTVIHCSADKSGELILPSTVKRIEKAAFANCKLLTSVVIPSGVTEIGESAFKSCSGLVYVTLPKGLTDIGDRAFGDCSALESVTIPNGVKSIGARAFTGCNGLREVVIPESTTWIGPGAFANCKNLKFVQIAAARAVLGYEAFYSCERLEAIIMPWEVDQGSVDYDWDDWPDCFYWFGAGASKKTIMLVHACDEDSKYLNTATYNAKKQFITSNLGCAAMVVDAVAVYDKNVVETDETNRWLSQSATTYDGGFAMRSAEIGDSLSSKARMRVVGPAEVSFYWKVSSEANYDWLTLSVDGAKSDQISGEKGWSRKTCTVPEGDHVVEWSYSKDGTQKSGSDCGWVDGVSVSPLGPRWVTHANADGTLTVVGLMDSPSGAINIPESISGKTVTAIGEQAFYKCDGLTAVTIPNSVTNIGAKAFAGCSLLGEGVVIASGCALCVNGICPESVELPAGTRLIADEAFASATVKSLTLPSSLTHVGNNAFQYCSSLATVHISDLSAWCRVKFVSGTSNPLCCAHHLYLGNAEIETLTIPNAVTSVSDYAFYECDGLKTVTIPDTVVSLGEKAFYGCGGITELSLPNGATSYGADLFYNCSELVSVTIPPSQTTFSTGMFSNCGKLKEIHISDLAAWCQSDFANNPLTWAGHLYLGDNEIVDLVVPEGVDCIGKNAFRGCVGLKSVSLSESVTSIGMYAFASCTGVTALRIPSSVTSVADYALSGCQGVVEIELENGVQTIGQYALSGNSALNKIFIPSTVTGIGKYAFNSCSKLLTVVVDRDDGERVKSLITSSMSSSYASRLNYVEAGLPHQVEFVIGEHGVRTGGGELIQTVAHGGAATAPNVQSDYGWKMSWDKTFGNITNDLQVSAVWTRESFYQCVGNEWWTTCVDDGEGVIIKGVSGSYGVHVFNGSNLVIPSEIGGRTVTGIDGGALKCSSALVSVTIPSSVLYMAEGALMGCENLDLVKTDSGDASRVRQMLAASGVDVSWVEFREKNTEGSTAPVRSEVILTVTNVVVNYIVNSVQPSFVLPATYDTGFVNIIAEVKGGCVAVPATWTVNYPKFTEKFGSDFTKALAMQTGKKDGAGNPMFVWQDYVAGTDPTDETDVFTASLTIVDGKVKVSYSPELDDARKAIRRYTTWGKVKLTDKVWSVVGEGEEGNFNFFKVTVEMK